MKILYIAPDITDSGGIARVLSLKTNYLVTRFKYEVSILSVNDSYPKCFYDFHPDVKWISVSKSNNLFLFVKSYISSINKTISQEKPDLIVICDAVKWFLIPWFVKTEIPIIFETHFSVLFKKNKFDKSLYRKFRSKLILFCRKKAITTFNYSVFLTDEASKDWSLENSAVIPNPLSFTAKSRADLVNKKAMAVCMNPYVKGLDRLLLVWSKIIKNYPDWALDIYGQWDDNAVFVKMTEDLKIRANVNFLPVTTDIESSYKQSSVFLMTSRYEAFPMVILESMASGVPCIAYDCPSGPREIIKDGKNGFLIEDGNTDSFVQKLELLIQEPNHRMQMGENAQESSNKYDIEVVMKKWDTLFLNLKK